jgi:hypothetical protein
MQKIENLHAAADGNAILIGIGRNLNGNVRKDVVRCC